MAFVFNKVVQKDTTIAAQPAVKATVVPPPPPPVAQKAISPFAALKKSTAASATSTVKPALAQTQKAIPEKDTVLKTDAVTILENDPIVGVNAEDEEADSVPEVVTAEEFNNPQQPDKMASAAVRELQTNMQLLLDSMDMPEQLGQQLYNLMQHIQTHPFLVGNLAPQDVGMMVLGLRMTYGVVIQKKVQKKEKRTARALTASEINEALEGFGQLEA